MLQVKVNPVPGQRLSQEAMTQCPVGLGRLGRHTLHGCYTAEERRFTPEPNLTVQGGHCDVSLDLDKK